MRLGRHSFLAGLITGVAVWTGVVAALAVAGVVETKSLYVDEVAVVQAWDTRGSADRAQWRPVNQKQVDIPRARDVVIENGAIRLRWAGTPDNPLGFRIEAASARVTDNQPESIATADPSFDPGPVHVTVVSDIETRLEISTPRWKQRTMVFAAYHGYATEISAARAGPAARVRMELGAFLSPMVISDGTEVLIDRVEPQAASATQQITAGRGYVIAAAGSVAPLFLLAARDAEVVASAEPSGVAHSVFVQGRTRMRAFVGSLSGAPEPTGLFAPARRLRLPSLSWVGLSRDARDWTPMTRRSVVTAHAGLLLPEAGDGLTLEVLAGEGFSSLAAF